MALYPEVQKRAQEEIEQFAPNRLPTLDDYSSLPYIRSLLKELTRWAPVAPLGLPHRVMQDDIYENYEIEIVKKTRRIPKYMTNIIGEYIRAQEKYEKRD